MSFLNTRNRGAEKLMAFGPLGFLFALILGHDGHLSKTPLAIGAGLGLLGLVFKLAHRTTKEDML
ncbi:hypothetical protein HDF17_002534 [Granulicella arctica]|uniref:Uncharacterized protein n=1 Tax=Granulicella arctica TaxID=940613 RepID=A0A7Y9TH56_9BACT|nr:hypothetical protein [Granulicella arctica]